jgi:hypothetical protein
MQVRDLQLKKVDVSGAKGPPDSDGGRQPKSLIHFQRVVSMRKGDGSIRLGTHQAGSLSAGVRLAAARVRRSDGQDR